MERHFFPAFGSLIRDWTNPRVWTLSQCIAGHVTFSWLLFYKTPLRSKPCSTCLTSAYYTAFMIQLAFSHLASCHLVLSRLYLTLPYLSFYSLTLPQLCLASGCLDSSCLPCLLQCRWKSSGCQIGRGIHLSSHVAGWQSSVLVCQRQAKSQTVCWNQKLLFSKVMDWIWLYMAETWIWWYMVETLNLVVLVWNLNSTQHLQCTIFICVKYSYRCLCTKLWGSAYTPKFTDKMFAFTFTVPQ